jgi:Fur family iron response transcriptional regulator
VTRDKISELLLQKGVFPTRQRLDVGEVILSRPQHLSAEQIIGEMRKTGSRVSKATVYNTLNLFRDRGLLTTVEVDPSRQFYDSTIEPHHHFYNVETGELIDIPKDSLKLEVHTPLPHGTEQAGVEVVIKVRGAGAGAGRADHADAYRSVAIGPDGEV